jgi:hypothetical protein
LCKINEVSKFLLTENNKLFAINAAMMMWLDDIFNVCASFLSGGAGMEFLKWSAILKLVHGIERCCVYYL